MSLVCMWIPYKFMQLHGIMPHSWDHQYLHHTKLPTSLCCLIWYGCVWKCHSFVVFGIVTCNNRGGSLWLSCGNALIVCHVTSGVASHHTEYIRLASVMHRSHEHSKTVEFSWSFNLQSSTTGWSYLLPKLSNIHSVSLVSCPRMPNKHPLEEVQNLC